MGDVLGKIICLLNNTFYRCETSSSEDEKENLLEYWKSEFLLINKKRKKMEGDFYKLGIITCKNLTWDILLFSLTNMTPETRPRLKFNMFEWLQHAINILDKINDDELLKKMCPAVAKAAQISLIYIESPKWKKKIIKTTKLFLKKNEEKLTELKLWNSFDDIINLENVQKNKTRHLKKLGSFATLCGYIKTSL